jgi:hypothetical protein
MVDRYPYTGGSLKSANRARQDPLGANIEGTLGPD